MTAYDRPKPLKSTLKILYDVDGWAFHHEARALAKHAPADFEVSLTPLNLTADAPQSVCEAHMEQALDGEEPDVVFLLEAEKGTLVKRSILVRGWRTRLVVSWNNGWPHRQDRFHSVYKDADALIINNFEYWNKMGRLASTHPISNGVDLATFTVQRPPQARRHAILWMGSQYHRTIKGYDAYIVPLMRVLEADGLSCEAMLVDSFASDKRTPAEMARWYNQGTVYVCASETEGTPNTALEAAACGCVVVSTRVGNMPELIRSGENGYLVDRSLDALVTGVRQAVVHYAPLSRRLGEDILLWDWRERSKQFYAVFRQVLDRPVPASGMPSLRTRNLTHALTVFVTTVGASSFDACMEHLRRQDCTFTLEVIGRVAPMSAAFQRMMDRCSTPFYVQVDEDMLLHPHAVRTLHERIAGADPTVAILTANLWDQHLERCIIGVKIFRHAIVRQFPFADVESCEKDQNRRLQDNGFRIETAPVDQATRDSSDTLGLHGTHYTGQSIFERYSTLMRHRNRHPRPMAWFDRYAIRFMERFYEEPSEQNYFALMGVIAGRLTHCDGDGEEKDYREYSSAPGFSSACAFLETFTAGGPGDPCRQPDDAKADSANRREQSPRRLKTR